MAPSGRECRLVKLVGLALLFGGLLLGGASSAGAQDADQRATVLHLSETAERPVKRDLLRVELRVDESGADARTVQSAINRRMTAALDRVHQTPGVRVETGLYSVDQERQGNGPAHWRGSQSVILTGKDADALLKLAGVLQSDGLIASSLRYQTSPETVQAAQDELTAEAIAALDRRATSIAGSMHLTVLRYRDLHVGNAETADRPVPRFAAMAASSPVAEPGESSVRVTVDAELLLARSQP